MLLQPLPTMSATAYAKAAKPAVAAVVDALGGAEGALDLLTRARVNSMPYRALAEERVALAKPLRDAVRGNDLSEFRYAAENILRACQSMSLMQADLEATLLAVQVLDGLDSARAEIGPWQQLLHTGRSIAITAKIYGYFDPERWTIFHPRAVAHLQALLRPLVEAEPALASVVAFPMPHDGASLAAVSEWGVVRDGSDAKLAFLYLSWFLRHVATALLRDSRTDRPTAASGRRGIDRSMLWKVHYVEMTLAAAFDRARVQLAEETP